MERKVIGRYIVSDPAICDGKPTFRGTRIMVWQVLEQVASGMAWDTIVAEWRGKVNREAIADAVQLASQAFIDHVDEYLKGEPPDFEWQLQLLAEGLLGELKYNHRLDHFEPILIRGKLASELLIEERR